MSAPPLKDRLTATDLAELRTIIRDMVRDEVSQALSARIEGERVSEAPPSYVRACIGDCIAGWHTCMLCAGGQIPLWDCGSRTWTECGNCKESGRPGFIRCTICNSE